MPAKKQPPPPKDGTLSGTYEFESSLDAVNPSDEISKFEGRLRGEVGGATPQRGRGKIRPIAEPKRGVHPQRQSTAAKPVYHTGQQATQEVTETAADIKAVQDLDNFHGGGVDSDSD